MALGLSQPTKEIWSGPKTPPADENPPWFSYGAEWNSLF
jgi:hypothetical protein